MFTYTVAFLTGTALGLVSGWQLLKEEGPVRVGCVWLTFVYSIAIGGLVFWFLKGVASASDVMLASETGTLIGLLAGYGLAVRRSKRDLAGSAKDDSFL